MRSHRRLVLAALAALLVVGAACAPVHPDGLKPADDADYELGGQRCRLDGAQASLSGTLVNRSGAARRWAVSAAFDDDGRGLSSATDFSDGAVADGSEWSWRVEVTVDPERVRPEDLGCAVARVDLGDPVTP